MRRLLPRTIAIFSYPINIRYDFFRKTLKTIGIPRAYFCENDSIVSDYIKQFSREDTSFEVFYWNPMSYSYNHALNSADKYLLFTNRMGLRDPQLRDVIRHGFENNIPGKIVYCD